MDLSLPISYYEIFNFYFEGITHDCQVLDMVAQQKGASLAPSTWYAVGVSTESTLVVMTISSTNV